MTFNILPHYKMECSDLCPYKIANLYHCKDEPVQIPKLTPEQEASIILIENKGNGIYLASMSDHTVYIIHRSYPSDESFREELCQYYSERGNVLGYWECAGDKSKVIILQNFPKYSIIEGNTCLYTDTIVDCGDDRLPKFTNVYTKDDLSLIKLDKWSFVQRDGKLTEYRAKLHGKDITIYYGPATPLEICVQHAMSLNNMASKIYWYWDCKFNDMSTLIMDKLDTVNYNLYWRLLMHDFSPVIDIIMLRVIQVILYINFELGYTLNNLKLDDILVWKELKQYKVWISKFQGVKIREPINYGDSVCVNYDNVISEFKTIIKDHTFVKELKSGNRSDKFAHALSPNINAEYAIVMNQNSGQSVYQRLYDLVSRNIISRFNS